MYLLRAIVTGSLVGGMVGDLAAKAKFPDPPPRTPSESIAATALPAGLRMEAVVSEPQIADPVAIAWGADGSLWVAEMADYPSGMDGEMQSGGRIRHLIDTTGDGRYDESSVFLEPVNFPTGVMAWRDGVIVTAAPEIFYAEDTDGDGRADRREAWVSGLPEANPQLRVNGLRWGLDNWIHCANGLRTTGEIAAERTGQTMKLGKRDFRLHPQTGDLQPESGATQFGRNRDDWGNWFGVHNSFPLWHFVVEDRYLQRNPFLASEDPKKQLVLPRNPPVYPRSQPIADYEHPHRGSLFTSACSAMVYRDELLFPDSKRYAFTCEPQHNLIHREVLEESGVSFSAHRPDREEHREFLASKDPWFRPVMVRTGPDGALWVVDMYRYQIEHPQWMPSNAHERLRPYMRAGDEHGRIYRIVPKKGGLRRIPELTARGASGWVEALESANGWQRDKAQQLLVEQSPKEAIPLLEEKTRSGESPKARLQALCTLDGMGALRASLVKEALHDTHAAIRRHAIRLAEKIAPHNPSLLESVAGKANDPDAKVRLQLACSLGEWKQPEAGAALAKLARTGPRDPYMQMAVLSAALPHFDRLIEAVIGGDTTKINSLAHEMLDLAWRKEAYDDWQKLFGRLVASVKEGDWVRGVAQLANWRQVVKERGAEVAYRITAAPPLSKSHKEALRKLLKRAREALAQGEGSVEEQVAFAQLLGWYPPTHESDVEILTRLLREPRPIRVQKAAVWTWALSERDAVAEALLDAWREVVGPVRTAIAEVVFQRTSWIAVLLSRMESGRISPASLDSVYRNRLLRYDRDSIRKRAEALFRGTSHGEPGDKAVKARLDAIRDLEGDPKDGRERFATHCAPCHQVNDLGRPIGPNLLSLSDRSPEALVTAILKPNQSIAPQYRTYEVQVDRDRVLLGLLTSETGNSITLQTADGENHTIPRDAIRAMRTLDWSLMPEGLGRSLTNAQLADLIAFLRSPYRIEGSQK